MNAEIQTFNFNTATLRILTDENGEPWFVAKDICDVLWLNNVSQALTRLDNDEKNSISLMMEPPEPQLRQSFPSLASTLSLSRPVSRKPMNSSVG